MSLTSRASFPGTARLRSPAEFAPALKGRRLARGALFVLSVAQPAASTQKPANLDATHQAPAGEGSTAPGSSGELPAASSLEAGPSNGAAVDGVAANPPIARLGLVIGKRYAPLSVSRNAIKRVIREAFRHKRHGLPAGDYVVRLHTRIAKVSLTALKNLVRLEIDAHLLRAARSARPDARPRAADNSVTPSKGATVDGTRV